MTDNPDQDERGSSLNAGDDELELELDLPQKRPAGPRAGTLFEGPEPPIAPDLAQPRMPTPGARADVPGAARRGGGAAIRPVQTTTDRSGLVMKLFLLGLLGVGGYGGYYGFCKYETYSKVTAFSREVHDLRQILMNKAVTIRPAHVKEVVLDIAQKTGVTVQAEQIEVTLEPLTAENRGKLNSIAQVAIGIAVKMPRHRTPRWLVGFKAPVSATHGVARHAVVATQYVWSDDARP